MTPSDSNTGEVINKPILMSIQDYYDEPVNLPKFSPDKLLGMMVLHTNEDEVMHVKVV